MPDFHIAEREDEYVLLVLTGELAGEMWTERLRDVLEEHFIDDGVRVIRTSLSGLSFMDNFGVATLVALHQEASERGKRFVVEDAQGQVREKLRVTGLLRVLEGD